MYTDPTGEAINLDQTGGDYNSGWCIDGGALTYEWGGGWYNVKRCKVAVREVVCGGGDGGGHAPPACTYSVRADAISPDKMAAYCPQHYNSLLKWLYADPDKSATHMEKCLCDEWRVHGGPKSVAGPGLEWNLCGAVMRLQNTDFEGDPWYTLDCYWELHSRS